MIVWTVTNQKGGVGKTTSAVTLGGLLAQQGKRVVLIDMDPQASLSFYFGIDSEALSFSVYDIFVAGSELNKRSILGCLCPTKLDSLFILPASMTLATLDRSMGTQSGMGLILKKALRLIEDDFDYVLIDCPPVLGILMVNAVAACDKIIIPVQTEFLALKGLQRMVRTLDIMAKSQKRDFEYVILPTMYDKRFNAGTEAYRVLCRDYPNQVWESVIPVDTRFRDASQAQSPPSVFNPRARGVFAYHNFLLQLQSNTVKFHA